MVQEVVLRSLMRKAIMPFGKYDGKKVFNFTLNVLERFMRRRRLVSFPIGIDLISTTRCNLKCFYCKKYDWGGKQDFTRDDFEFVAKTFFPRLLYVKFGSAGEALVNRDLGFMLEKCREYGVSVVMNSNGSLLDEEKIEMLFEQDVKIFGISLDGATRETAEGIRRGLDFELLIEKIRMIRDLKERYGRKYPILTVNFAVMRRNITELPSFVGLMSDLGVSAVRVMFLYVHEFMDPGESLFLHRELVEKYFALAGKSARASGIRLLLPPGLEGRNGDRMCFFPYHEIGLSPDGSVAFCCNAWGEEKMGNVFKQDFMSEIWNSGRYQELRRRVNSSRPMHTLCRECSALDRGVGGISRHFAREHHTRVREMILSQYGRPV
ncbi:MAG: radical SAM protein [Deltaproteobacteria bacterium]|nr:radical SAM protein [Deltaproteobacteria bacterium]